MKDFAKKSFRLSMDINLKAPVIVVPESSISHNALLADLGLIRIQNEFKLVSMDKSSLPPVIDNMDVQLTHLKLSRYKLLSFHLYLGLMLILENCLSSEVGKLFSVQQEKAFTLQNAVSK